MGLPDPIFPMDGGGRRGYTRGMRAILLALLAGTPAVAGDNPAARVVKTVVSAESNLDKRSREHNTAVREKAQAAREAIQAAKEFNAGGGSRSEVAEARDDLKEARQGADKSLKGFVSAGYKYVAAEDAH